MRKIIFSDNDDTDAGLLNLTPLIDVVFVVLICFILMAPLLKLDKIELSSGSSPELKELHLEDKNAPIVIKVFHDNTVIINERPVALHEVLIVLKSLRNQYPESDLRLYQDAKAHFGTYQSVKLAAETAGFKELDILIKPN